MNVLLTLGEALTKNGAKSPVLCHEKLLLDMFESAKPKNNKSTNMLKKAQKKPVSKNVYVKENIKAIGRGSGFQKKVVREYLSPLQMHDFSRHKIQNDYDSGKATRMHKSIRSISNSKNSQEYSFSNSKQIIGDLLAALVACSPKEVQMSSDNVVRHFPAFTMKEVPRIPNFKASPHLFEDYIGTLTHTKFLYKNSSSTNGIVPMILRNLMHPANLKTLYLRTTKAYNDMIYYFCEKFDFATCREIFAQMKIEGVPRNTITYNLMLRSVLKNSHIRKTKPVDSEVLYYLQNMRRNRIMADAITWTTCYNFLKDDIPRSIYIEQMQERNIPLTEGLVYTVLRNGPYNSKECLEFMASNKISLSSKLFQLCIDRLLQERRVSVAWLFLEHTIGKKEKDFAVGCRILNSFLRYFAKEGRLDMAITTFNTCVQDYRMKPDTQSFEMLFKTLTMNGYTKNFSIILQYLKSSRESFSLGKRKNYWLVRAEAISRFNVRQLKTFPQSKMDEATALLNGLKWSSTSSGFTTKTWRGNDSSLKKIYRFLGCVPPPLKTNRRTNGVNTIVTSAKKVKYRRRIRSIAVQNAMCKRVPFSSDWYGSLRRELQRRDIIDE